MADEAGPYIVPLNFGFSDDSLYFHSAHKGRKIDILKKNPRVCFEFDLGVKIISGEKSFVLRREPDGWTRTLGKTRQDLKEEPWMPGF